MYGNYWNTCFILPVRIINYWKTEAETCHLYISHCTPWWIWKHNWDLIERQRRWALPLNSRQLCLYLADQPQETAWLQLPAEVGGGATFLEAALRPSVTSGAPRYPPAFCHFGYKGSVLMLDSPRSQPWGQDFEWEPFIWEGIWEAPAGKGEVRWEGKAGSGAGDKQSSVLPGKLWETGWTTPQSFPCQGTRKLGCLSTKSHH